MQKEFYTLGEIAKIIGAELQGDPDQKIYSIASLDKAQEGQISFLAQSRYQLISNSRYLKFLPTTKASAVILSGTNAPDCPVNKLIVDDPYQGYFKVASLFERKIDILPGIHPSAIIGPHCHIAESASIGPNCVIGSNCKIGKNTLLESNVVIKDGTTIGSGCVIFPNVTIYHDVEIGDRVILQAGVVVGGDGFGLVKCSQGWKKIPHLGCVKIGNDVEVGANTTIDRGTIDDTVIENGVKLDNLIMIAHGVVIGENTVIAGCVGIAGSSHIGKNCMIGGAVGISDGVNICDNVFLTAMSGVSKSITEPGIYSSGTGLLPQKEWRKNIARLRNLDDVVRKLRKLEKKKNEEFTD